MQKFNSDGVEIAYLDEGDGDPILLIHGFASNAVVNWVNTGWVETLKKAGRRVIALDNRGHGQSEKLYDEAAYSAALMAEDARRLLDHLGLSRAAVMGYSMGARISVFLAVNHPERIERLIIAGAGANLLQAMGASGPIAAALLAPSADDVTNAAARSFRVFADQTKSDRKALAACIRAKGPRITPEMLAGITCPTLIAVGTEDVIAGAPETLASHIAGAQVLAIPGRDHMKAVGDWVYKNGVLAFLGQRGQ